MKSFYLNATARLAALAILLLLAPATLMAQQYVSLTDSEKSATSAHNLDGTAITGDCSYRLLLGGGTFYVVSATGSYTAG